MALLASSPRLMLVLAAACAAAPQLVAAQLVPVATPQIEPVAGNGQLGYSGDGDPATAARLWDPNFIAIDAEGDVYIAEVGNHTIRKVDTRTGFITTVAGMGGSGGYSGDGGPATAAQLNAPYGVAVDDEKNIYITASNRIRKVDGGTGIITTVAGTGTGGYSGDGGPATAALLNGPYGITTDRSGDVYWTEFSNFVVRKLDVETGTISTFAGTGSSGFSGDGGPATAAQFRAPWGVVFDASGNLYIADATGTYRVRKVDAGTGIITTVAGNGSSGYSGDGGPATAAQVGSPDGLAIDAFGNLYVTQFDEHVVRKLDARTGIITTIAGTGVGGYNGDGPAAAAQLMHPAGLAFGPGLTDLYIADRRNRRIRKVGLFVFEPPSPNEPPLAVGSVDDVDFDLGATARVSLAGLFTDEAPEQLTYAVSSSNPAAVAARLAGEAVELEGVAHGAATITVTATDTQDLSATLSFVVRSGMTVSFAADASAPEGGTIRLTLTASQPAPEALAVPYVFTVSGDPAADESDHAGGTGGTATFAAGATEAEITVPVLDDAVVEPVREHFTVTLAEPADDAGYGLGLKPQATATIDEGVCDRDPAVRDELRRTQPCEAVADLSRWTSLRLAGAGIERLRGEDLLGLSNLLLLDMSGNRLPAFPAAALVALPNLWSLRLADNRIDALPAKLEHPALRLLDLSRNRLAELPAGSLSGFTGLRRLHLSANALAALPGDAFTDLGSLRALRLDGNGLAALPAELFAGLGALEELHLHGNPGAPFMLAAELTRTDAKPWAPGPAQVAARVATGAPFTLRAALAAADGTAVSEVSVPAGAIQGPPAEVADGDTPLTLAAAPAPVPDKLCRQGLLDVPCYSGFATAAGAPLTLYKTPPQASPLPQQALDSDTLRLPLAERFGAAPGEVLTYAVESSDPAVASARVVAGVLVIEAEADSVATVTVTATDAYGQTGTLTFTVRATLPMRGGLRGWRLILVDGIRDGR